jgi:hypothetical protein
LDPLLIPFLYGEMRDRGRLGAISQERTRILENSTHKYKETHLYWLYQAKKESLRDMETVATLRETILSAKDDDSYRVSELGCLYAAVGIPMSLEVSQNEMYAVLFSGMTDSDKVEVLTSLYKASEVTDEFITEAFFEIKSSSMLQQVKFSAVENLYRIGVAHLTDVHCHLARRVIYESNMTSKDQYTHLCNLYQIFSGQRTAGFFSEEINAIADDACHMDALDKAAIIVKLCQFGAACLTENVVVNARNCILNFDMQPEDTFRRLIGLYRAVSGRMSDAFVFLEKNVILGTTLSDNYKQYLCSDLDSPGWIPVQFVIDRERLVVSQRSASDPRHLVSCQKKNRCTIS